MATGAEVLHEILALKLEATRGSAEASPTHYLPLKSTLTPKKTLYKPEETRGVRVRNFRAKRTRQWAEWEASGGADPNYLPLMLNMAVKAVSSPTTPSGATLGRLWTFKPTISADDIKTATMWFGDANVQVWQSAFCYADTLTIEADAGSEDGVTTSLKGMGLFPTEVADPTPPAQNIGSLIVPMDMQLWIDTGSDAIGTTEITGRFLKTSWEVPTGATPKYYAKGPGSDASFTKIGREAVPAKCDITVELNDESLVAEYANWRDDTYVKMRVRLNGDYIEDVSSDPTYEYIQLDIYGYGEDFSWETIANANRGMKISMESFYDSTLAADFQITVQNKRTTL